MKDELKLAKTGEVLGDVSIALVYGASSWLLALREQSSRTDLRVLVPEGLLGADIPLTWGIERAKG